MRFHTQESVLIGILMLISQFTSGDCSRQASLGAGNWKETVLSADGRLKMLEAELRQSLQQNTECEEDGKTRNVARAGAGEQSPFQSSTGFKTTEISESDTSYESRASGEGSILTEEMEAGRVKSRIVERADERLGEGQILSEEDELRRVLREAIVNENDPIKRRALVTRYEQLFGDYDN